MWEYNQYLMFYYNCNPELLTDPHHVLMIAIKALDSFEGIHHRTYVEHNSCGNVAVVMKNDMHLMISTSRDFSSVCTHLFCASEGVLGMVIDVIMRETEAKTFDTIII
jgi:hypothetical protein